MHSRILAERSDAAQKTIVEAAKRIATAAPEGIITPEMIATLESRERDPAVTAMLRLEGVGAILNAIADGLSVNDLGSEDSEEETPLLLPERDKEDDEPDTADSTKASSEHATPSEPASGASTPLPDAFPFRETLTAAGIETIEELRLLNREELMTLDGIGPARADQIIATATDG